MKHHKKKTIKQLMKNIEKDAKHFEKLEELKQIEKKQKEKK